MWIWTNSTGFDAWLTTIPVMTGVCPGKTELFSTSAKIIKSHNSAFDAEINGISNIAKRPMITGFDLSTEQPIDIYS